MLTSIIELPDGSYVSSGSSQTNAIKSVKLTEVVNSAGELTLGSTCAAMVEVRLLTPGGGLDLTAGDEIILYKDDAAAGLHSIVGTFIIEQPTRPTANTMKLIGYDRVAKLDKDLTEWLRGLDGWPYSLLEFAGMVCVACGLELATTEIPNGDYEVTQFTEECTGRQLMQWIGEAAGRFCRATPFGKIELATYTENANKITPGGSIYYFANSLSAENYQVQPVDAVQLKLAAGEDGYLWPEGGENNYVITWNPILYRVTDGMETVLETICAEIPSGYTPCKVSIPANLLIRAGDIVSITDKNGKSFKTLVMQREQVGQRDTLTCTGSMLRGSSTAVNNKTVAQLQAENKAYADGAARLAVDRQTQADVFNRLTKNGALKGLYMQDGELYINATYLALGVLASADGETFVLDLVNNILKGKFAELSIKGMSVEELAQKSVKVGGTNLLLNTEPSAKLSPWYGANSTVTTVVEFDGRKCFHIDPSTSAVSVGNLVQTVAADGGDYVLTAEVYVETDRIIYLSTWNADSGNWVGVTQKAIACTAGWNHLETALTNIPAAGKLVVGIGGGQSGGAFYVWHPQLETGNVATDWSPAPADNLQTQATIFETLFGNGGQGFILKNGRVYVSAEVMATGILRSADGTVAIDLSNNTVTINSSQNGKIIQLQMSASGFKAYAENSDGEMEQVLDFDMGGDMPGIINPSWREITGLLIAAANGVLTLGTTEAATEIYGSYVAIDSPTKDLRILAKTASWKSNGDGTYTLIGTD